MKGNTVVVRAFAGEPLVRRVWEATPEVVAVCREETYRALVKGEAGARVSYFDRADVFVFDAGLIETLGQNWYQEPSGWDRLTPWRD